MGAEEFSFPTINSKNIARLTVTPSLWRISSLDLYSDLDNQFEINGRKGFFRRSFCDIEETKRELHHCLTEAEVENKMDLLWEDFNDDAHDDSTDFEGKSSLGGYGSEDHECGEKNGLDYAAELCYVHASNMSKKGSSDLVLPQKKHKMMLVFKVLMKKILLLQKMARMKRKGP